jgi:hypothetical protein
MQTSEAGVTKTLFIPFVKGISVVMIWYRSRWVLGSVIEHSKRETDMFSKRARNLASNFMLKVKKKKAIVLIFQVMILKFVSCAFVEEVLVRSLVFH